ncbi:hypothetical protein LTR85_006226 [Meristemomyces frigidus]|nr:hypothetical protein LTR85_006226 [Meristemomyces frigidus]
MGASNFFGGRVLFAQLVTITVESLYQLVLALDAVRLKNTIQTCGVCVNNLSILISVSLGMAQASSLLNYLITGGLTDTPGWDEFRGLHIALLASISVSSVGMCLMAWKLYDEYAWAIYRHISAADRQLRRRFMMFEVFRAYTFGTAGYFAVQALPLLLTPKLIVSMLATDPRPMTDLEAYFSRSLALLLLAFAVTCLLLTGAIPLTNSIADNVTGTDSDGTSKDPYAYPTLVVTTTYHALSAFYLYTQIAYRGSFGFGAGLLFSASLFCLGVWVTLFGSEKGKISKKTGADKRTSNFPFSNTESAKEKKKESKRKSVARTTSSRG